MNTLLKPANIFLIGLMGSGKSSLGRCLAQLLQLNFLDADHELETCARLTVSAIFAREGEQGFRQRETQLIAELTKQRRIVLATGGGVVLNPANCRALAANGIVIYLYAPIAQLVERTLADKQRPLLQNYDPYAVFEKLQAERESLYQHIADFAYDTSQLSITALGDKIKQDLQQQGYFE